MLAALLRIAGLASLDSSISFLKTQKFRPHRLVLQQITAMPHLIANLPSETDAINIGGQQLLLWRPIEAEKLVLETTQAEFGEDERMPYWAILWPASIALAEFLVECVDVEGKRILELGAGLAVPGLAAARAGAQVVASDWYAEPLEFVQSSARLNGIALETQRLDWRFPPDSEPFDLIIGADLLYERRNHAPILDCATKLLSPTGKMLLSDPERLPSQAFLDHAAAMGWETKAHPSTVEWEGGTFAVNCWEISRSKQENAST